MAPPRWSNVLRRITTAGPYVDERLSIVVLTSVVVAGMTTVAYADTSVAPFSFAPLYFLPLALSALVHPLRVSLTLSIVCLALDDLLSPLRDAGGRHLRRGDVLVLYTDGAVEAENPAGEQYSAERLSKTVSRHLQQSAGELIETIYASLIQFQQTTSLADDLTLVLLKTL